MSARLPIALAAGVSLLVVLPPSPGQPLGPQRILPLWAEPAPPATDAQLLVAAGLKPDDPGALLDYLRRRTPTAAQLDRIRGVIRRLGAGDFDARQVASREAVGLGASAVGPLQEAARTNPDPEVAYRARECLRRMGPLPDPAVAAAVARAVGRHRPEGAAAALVGFLPQADDPAAADAVRAALIKVAAPGGVPDPALFIALADPVAVRRAAAGVVLIAAGGPDGVGKVRAASAIEPDPDAKFQMLFGLLGVAHDHAAVGPLIQLLAVPELPRGRLWQVEDFLLQLSALNDPPAKLGKTPDSLAGARDAWQVWWDGAAAKTDLGRFVYVPRTTGHTTVVLLGNQQFGGTGAVADLGPDLRDQWRFTAFQPMDARLLANGRVAVAEMARGELTLRDTAGRVVATRKAELTTGPNGRVPWQPHQVQELPNGNLLVVGRNGLVELKKDSDDKVMEYFHPAMDLAAAGRLPDGTTLVVTQNGQNLPNVNNHGFFLDGRGKVIPDRRLGTGMPMWLAAAGVTRAGHFLLPEMNQVVEYDPSTGKKVWSRTAAQPRSAQRLPNGNTLIVEHTNKVMALGGMPASRLAEYAPDGEEVWSYQPPAGTSLFRAYRH